MSGWPRQSPVDVALRGACPRCGRGRLFRGLLGIVDQCSACGLDLRGNDAGDGPAVFVILLVFWVELRRARGVDAAYPQGAAVRPAMHPSLDRARRVGEGS